MFMLIKICINITSYSIYAYIIKNGKIQGLANDGFEASGDAVSGAFVDAFVDAFINAFVTVLAGVLVDVLAVNLPLNLAGFIA